MRCASRPSRSTASPRLAYVDTLTGLANRRRFEETVAAMGEAPPRCFAVAVLDIDFFKRINDTWSHATGDAVLRAVGQILAAECRDQDLVARIGGEEFVITLNGGLAAQAFDACERVRAAVERHDWARLQEGMAVTISIGLAGGDGAAPLGELLERANRHLHSAKRGGRIGSSIARSRHSRNALPTSEKYDKSLQIRLISGSACAKSVSDTGRRAKGDIRTTDATKARSDKS